MSDHERVLQLVEEALDTDRTPEQVCADTPHFLPAVRASWERCRLLYARSTTCSPPRTGGRGDRASAVGRPVPTRRPGCPARPFARTRCRRSRATRSRRCSAAGASGSSTRAPTSGCAGRSRLKMLLSGAYAGGAERIRFLREARAVAALRHAHVVQVYDVGEHDGLPTSRWSTSRAARWRTSSPARPNRPRMPPCCWRRSPGRCRRARRGDRPPRPEAGQRPDRRRRHAEGHRLRPRPAVRRRRPGSRSTARASARRATWRSSRRPAGRGRPARRRTSTRSARSFTSA